jgi:prepilin-type processing-associated H-X9-DG protein
MPSLNKARKQAKVVVCQSNLKQWGAVWSMYVDDNNGYFNNGDVSDWDNLWMSALWPYIKDNFDFGCCPEALKAATEDVAPGQPGIPGGVFKAWVVHTGDWGWVKDNILRCSYGWNAYACNPPGAINYQFPTKYNWRSPYVKGAYNIPLFLDGTWIGSWMVDNNPMRVRSMLEPGGFCIPRHGRAVNALFCDWSVRKVGLKELWTLNWNRNFFKHDVGPTESDWPDWMKKY